MSWDFFGGVTSHVGEELQKFNWVIALMEWNALKKHPMLVFAVVVVVASDVGEKVSTRFGILCEQKVDLVMNFATCTMIMPSSSFLWSENTELQINQMLGSLEVRKDQ